LLDIDVGLAKHIKARHHILAHIQVVGLCSSDDAVEHRTGVRTCGGLVYEKLEEFKRKSV